jgi:hypothetical protein
VSHLILYCAVWICHKVTRAYYSSDHIMNLIKVVQVSQSCTADSNVHLSECLDGFNLTRCRASSLTDASESCSMVSWVEHGCCILLARLCCTVLTLSLLRTQDQDTGAVQKINTRATSVHTRTEHRCKSIAPPARELGNRSGPVCTPARTHSLVVHPKTPQFQPDWGCLRRRVTTC